MSLETELLTNSGHSEQAAKMFREQRIKANMELLELLKAMLLAYPDLRFSQALANFGFTQLVKSRAGDEYNYWEDEYNFEPVELVNRVKNIIDQLHT